jgi:ABC-2 family transporter protein
MRWSIIRTLLWKEMLRFRYNWGLLLMVGAVLAMSALVSLGERMGQIPGQSARIVKVALLEYDKTNPRARDWAASLRRTPPEWFTQKNRIPILDIDDPAARQQRGVVYPDDFLTITLRSSSADARYPWMIAYDFRPHAQVEAMQYRLWVQQITQQLRGNLAIREVLPSFSNEDAASAEDRIPKVVTALVIFAFYLLSFNLYITSTAEEREKKSLLALMLSPARPIEVIGAKVIFYSLSSLLVATGVVAFFDPTLLAQPLLWTTILAGSISYVSIGTVILCIVRRQSTINTVSMMYLLVTALVMAASVFLIPFMVLRFMMIENYLFHQLEMIIGRKPNPAGPIYQPIMLGLTAGWFFLSVFVFSKVGMLVAQGRK